MKNQTGVGEIETHYYVEKEREAAALYIPISTNSEFTSNSKQRGWKHYVSLTVAFIVAIALAFVLSGALRRPTPPLADPFYSSIVEPHDVCGGVTGKTVSHSGLIGLKGDSDLTPKRSFFW